ncbi:collagenase [Oscillochloris sp. ZM17-4]|uniref:collagenase n=1 Tax=Oscillochloris sp. ZM17-4 TaxID=2866714 RepID=UPI002107E675|nr:collagenase [Oscillochloris sp. ZM17-4]
MLRPYIVIVICLLLLPSSALPLAPGPAVVPPARTPSCADAGNPDAAALLAALPGAGYACAEEIAAALRPRAEEPVVDALISLATDARRDTRARRNGLRALGRLAESPPASRAGELMRRTRAAATRAALDQILAGERDSFLVQDAIWIYDTFYFPSFGTQPALERVSADVHVAPALRARAALAAARLIGRKAGPLADADHDSIRAGMFSDDPGVRAAAADCVARLRDDRLTPQIRAELGELMLWAQLNQPPMALVEDAPDMRGSLAFADAASTPTDLTVSAAVARAQDRLEGGAHLAQLRADYEALALPSQLEAPGFLLRSGLPEDELPALLGRTELLRVAYAQALGPALSAPLPGEPSGPIRVLIFASQAIYRDYMRAFTPFTVDVDGVYDEATRTLYTHQRRPDQSANTLGETIQHELTHALTGETLFRGLWADPGYHAEPRGWADEGLAEVMAGAAPDGAGGAILAPRPAQLSRLCALPAPPALAELLARRAGYDRFGSFDYDGAWALSYYLLTERPEAARRIYAAYRDGSYRLAAWPQLAGEGLDSFEASWHAAIGRWCERANGPRDARSRRW